MASKRLQLSIPWASLLDADARSQEKEWFLSYRGCIVGILRTFHAHFKGSHPRSFHVSVHPINVPELRTATICSKGSRTIIACLVFGNFDPNSMEGFLFICWLGFFLVSIQIGFHSPDISSLCLTAWRSDLAMFSASGVGPVYHNEHNIVKDVTEGYQTEPTEAGRFVLEHQVCITAPFRHAGSRQRYCIYFTK